MAMPSKTSPPGVSTHSRPKAAAGNYFGSTNYAKVSTHSRPKAAAFLSVVTAAARAGFQHTAARRRLLFSKISNLEGSVVSTHSRPKAAAGASGNG